MIAWYSPARSSFSRRIICSRVILNPLVMFPLVIIWPNLFWFCARAAEVWFVNGLFSAAGVPLSAEFALGRKRPRALFARSWFGPGEFLPFAREARLGHPLAGASAAFRTALAAVS